MKRRMKEADPPLQHHLSLLLEADHSRVALNMKSMKTQILRLEEF